jgi:hypothetical protein
MLSSVATFRASTAPPLTESEAAVSILYLTGVVATVLNCAWTGIAESEIPVTQTNSFFLMRQK